MDLLSEQLQEANLVAQPVTVCQSVTPWDVKGEVVDGQQLGINYEKLMFQFGCQPLSADIVSRFERLTGKRAHPLMRRGLFYCHRDFDKILDLYEQGKPFFLYTGRGPSSDSMHLGHLVPFIFCKFLQDAFQCHLVVMLSDDEKYLFKDLSLAEVQHYARENAKDIIAVGFDPKLTFIFVNTKYMAYMFETVLQVQRLINFNQASSVFGFEQSDSIGKIAYPATQIATAFSQAFPHLLGGKTTVPCLIPYAIDQDPYFRLGRDIAHRLKSPKPASVCSQFFPALQGFHTKMSASDENSAIFLTDTDRQIKDKINKFAFSGGGDTLELHRKFGGRCDVDIPFQYLRFFHEDDAEMEWIRAEYSTGRMLTGEIKAKCIECLQLLVSNYQKKRASVTDETVELFMSIRPVQ
jgi:tryptophanyl-tRNA synthetase